MPYEVGKKENILILCIFRKTHQIRLCSYYEQKGLTSEYMVLHFNCIFHGRIWE